MLSEDDEIMARFVRDYLALLDQRVQSIVDELESGKDHETHVKLLSLESTSRMAGANDLAKVAGLLRSALEAGKRTRVPGLAVLMSIEARKVPDRLSWDPR